MNAIAPGWFETEMNDAMFSDGGGQAYMESGAAMGRPGIEGELDGAMLYLASDVADELGVREAFRRATGRRVITLADVFPPWELDTFGATEHSAGSIGGPSTANAALARDMRFGNVDQHVCAEARFFAGNVFSSFTHHVCYLRVLRGVPAACVGSDVYGLSLIHI